jgi:hypothetical protein
MRFIQLWRRTQVAYLKRRCQCTALYTVKSHIFLVWIVNFLFIFFFLLFSNEYFPSLPIPCLRNFQQDLWPNRSHNRCWSFRYLEELWDTLDWGSAGRKATYKNCNSSANFRIHETRVLAIHSRVTLPHVSELNLSIYFVLMFSSSQVTCCIFVGICHFQSWGPVFPALCALLRTPSYTLKVTCCLSSKFTLLWSSCIEI